MNRLLFKNWLLSEIADFGFGQSKDNRPQGGTERMAGDELFKVVDGSLIVNELARLPALGPNSPMRKWDDMVEWGHGPGAIQVGVTPLGSMRLVIRRLASDLTGDPTWVAQRIVELGDEKAMNQELNIAHNVYESLTKLMTENIPSPKKDYDELDRLAVRMWTGVKKTYPSYCMFPVSLRKQHENYFKMVFEFRGHGVQKSGSSSRAEQYNIDLFFDERKGLIRCWGYDIDSALKQHSWQVQPSDFDEWFSPNQDVDQIVEVITKTFMQY